MRDLNLVFDSLDLAVARAAESLAPDVAAPALARAAAVHERRGFLGGTLVIAIAGGTGSGKSSLLNAIAGEDVASVSQVRPHTDAPLAWLPADAEPNLGEMLRGYGIAKHVPHDDLPGIALIDLPDHDSVDFDHRAIMRQLVERVDAVIWVVDPEKYRDPLLYREHLRPLARYQGQFLFVLNQIDRLGPDVDAVIYDLEDALRGAGVRHPVVYAVAARPPEGDPRGIVAVREHLRARLDAKRVALGKLFADLSTLRADLAHETGVGEGGSVRFDDRWSEVRDHLVTAITAAAPGAAEDAMCRLEDFVAAIAVETGGAFGARLRAEFPPDRLVRLLESAIEQAQEAAPHRTRSRRRRRAAPPPWATELRREIDDTLGAPLRRALWDRAMLGATLTRLGVEVAEAEAALNA